MGLIIQMYIGRTEPGIRLSNSCNNPGIKLLNGEQFYQSINIHVAKMILHYT